MVRMHESGEKRGPRLGVKYARGGCSRCGEGTATGAVNSCCLALMHRYAVSLLRKVAQGQGIILVRLETIWAIGAGSSFGRWVNDG